MSLLLARQTLTDFPNHQVHLGFTGRPAGNLGLHIGLDQDQALANRQRLEEAFLPEGGRGFTYLRQVHGIRVYDADSGLTNSLGPGASSSYLRDQLASAQQVEELAAEADAASSSQGQPLAIMVADCIPLILVGRHRQDGSPVIGVAHAGRRGLLDGVIQAELADLLARGAQKIQVWLGPSICGSCYEVPADMLEETSLTHPAAASQTSWGSPALDLPAAAYAILESLPEVEAIHRDFNFCTLEDDRFFSHRAYTAGQRPAGRLAGLVWCQKKQEEANHADF